MSVTTDRMMDRAAALALTERIRSVATDAADRVRELAALVAEAKAGNAHEALGFASWTAYLADVMSGAPLRLEPDERREVVGMLTDQGMSTRTIAPVVGVTKSEVSRDRQVSRRGTPGPVTGADGKTYRHPAPKPDPAPDEPEQEPGRVPVTPTPPPTEVQTVVRWLVRVDQFLTAAPKSLPKRQTRPIDPQSRARALRTIDRAITRLTTWRDQLEQETSI